MLDHTTCPECARPARVEWRDVLESTDGPVEHAKVRCTSGEHWFLLPVATLAERADRTPRRAAAAAVSRTER